MIVHTFQQGLLSTNCYVLQHQNTCVVVDVAFVSQELENFILQNKLKLQAVLLTHGHFDHILAVGDLRNINIPVGIHKNDAHMLTERDMFSAIIPYDPRPFEPAEILFDKEGEYSVAGFDFYVIPTPGHTSGSVCYVFDGMMFTGDTLFKNSIGRTDLGGDEKALLRSLKALKNLPGDYEIFPGHDRPSFLSEERRNNPYLRNL